MLFTSCRQANIIKFTVFRLCFYFRFGDTAFLVVSANNLASKCWWSVEKCRSQLVRAKVYIGTMQDAILNFRYPIRPYSNFANHRITELWNMHIAAGNLSTSWDMETSVLEAVIFDFTLSVRSTTLLRVPWDIAAPRKHRYSRLNCVENT